MFVISGGRPLCGVVSASGSKNAALPIMAASLVCSGQLRLSRVPDVVDVHSLRKLLATLGVRSTITADEPGGMTLEATSQKHHVAGYELVRKMRAGICVLGPLLASRGHARVSLPGGCNIGHRPIDLHLRGLSALGADLRVENGYVVAEADRLRGAEVNLAGPHGSTVTGTCNIMTAAALASGRTVITSAACEPEVIDLGHCLNRMGGNISGLGTPVIEIDGVDQLAGATHEVIPDRIETGTLLIAAAITGGDVTVLDARADHLVQTTNLLQHLGVCVQLPSSSGDAHRGTCEIRARANGRIRAAHVVAGPYPGVPTDLQAQLMALLCIAHGSSTVVDRVFPDRFLHAAELMRLGARIHRRGDSAVIDGVARLGGANVMAGDLRASAALVLAGLAAEGHTEIRRIYHLDRGYEQLETKLNGLGARITRTDDTPEPGSPHWRRQRRTASTT